MLLPLLILIITVSFSFASIESEFNHDFLTKINQENSLTRTEVRRTEKMGRGVYATTDIERDDVLFTVRILSLQLQHSRQFISIQNQKVPLDNVVCVQTIQKFRPRLMEYVDRNEISSEDAMALYLIEERADPESRFQTWFPLMPNEFESPPFFNKEELNLLKGDDIYQKAVNARRTYRRNFDRIQENVKDADFSYEDYVWAKHMIESRAWHLRGKQYLVPMADFFNHRPHPSVKYEDYVPDVRGEFFEKHHRITDCCAEVVADRPAKKGAEVYETYVLIVFMFLSLFLSKKKNV